METHDAPEADLPAPPVAAPSTREVSASTSGESSDTSEEPFIQTVPIAGDHACDEAIPIEETRQPVEAVDLSRPSPPSVPEQPDAGPMIEALPVPVAAQEESKPPIIHAAPDVAPEGVFFPALKPTNESGACPNDAYTCHAAVPAIPVETERPRDECVKVDDDKADEPPACEVEKDVVPPASKERDVPAHEDDAPRQDPPIGPVEPSLLPPVIQAPSIAPALPATANSSAQSTVRENPESKSIHHSKRASLKGPIEHILNAHVEKPSTPLVPPPMAIVGVPRARSNTVADHAVPVPARTSSRPAAMRATASRVHAQLAVAGAADLEPDTDGEPSWAWDELNRQLDEEEDRKRRAHYRPLADGTVNLDAWWIAFELAWEANMRRGRGVRTWWDLEKYWKPSEVFAAEDDASHPIPETKTEKPVAEDKEAKVGGHEGSNTNVNGEQTLVSSSERSPRRSDSRNSLKTLAAPGTNQSKRGAAPQTEQARPATKEIPEESAGHTTPTSLSSSITSSRSSSRSSSKSRRNETDPKVTSDSQQAEPILRSSDFRTMWAEAERRWAEQEKVTSGNKDSVKDTQLPKTNMDGTTPPEVKPSADDRERARGRSREERPQSRTNTRPPIFQRGDYAPEDGHHKRQKEQEQFNVYAQSVPAQPNMFSRRQSEPSLRAAETDPNDGLLRGRRGRNARPKLHIDTDLTDYTQSAPRMPKAKAKAQQQPHVQPVPQIHSQPPPQAQPQNQPPPQARPVPPQHSQSHTQQQSSRAQPQSQPKPHSRPGGRAPPPPVMLRAIPVASDRTQSRIAVAWRAYEARWESMLALSSRELITFATIPWPVLHPPKSYADGDGLAALSTLSIAQFLLSPDHSPGIPARDRLRAAIRKWHSDKFNRFVARMRSDDGEDEAGRIMEGVGVVARALTQLLELERGD